MFFDLVPADVIIKIFHQLPFKDRFRLRGVNRQFRDASIESIAKMKSLILNDVLVEYLIWTQDQSFSSLLESCSSTLESIEVSNRSCIKPFLSALSEFVYPKLEHLEITANYFNTVQMKKLISRNQYLRSVVLNLDCRFEWPEEIVFEKMETLEIQYANFHKSTIDLSPTLRPLVGKVPNLKRLLIHTEFIADCRFILSAQEFDQFLFSAPSLEELKLGLSHSTSVMEFKAAIPTWHLPKLTTLEVNLDCPEPSFILHHLPNLCPRLESFTSITIKDIKVQDIMALSQMKRLRKLSLLRLDTMKAQQIIDLVTSVPSMTNLMIKDILDVDSPESVTNFLTSTAAIFRRKLVIVLADFTWDGSDSELEDILEGMEDRVTYHEMGIMTIRYNP